MRMWMVPPRLMCRKHLLGEHVEIHMLEGHLRRGKSIDGFLLRGLLEPHSMRTRHDAIAAEMARRGYRHQSPLPPVLTTHNGHVNTYDSLAELYRRCIDCRARIKEGA